MATFFPIVAHAILRACKRLTFDPNENAYLVSAAVLAGESL